MPSARLAARRSILFSPPDQGRLSSRAAIAARQSMTASAGAVAGDAAEAAGEVCAVQEHGVADEQLDAGLVG